MSRSPLDIEADPSDYLAGWYTLNALLRRGFSWSGNERNVCFLNTGGPAFADVSAVTGFDFEDDGRSLAGIDWDFDGDLDLLATNRTGPRVRLLRNELRVGDSFTAVKLEGVDCNRDAVGARVELSIEGGAAPVLLRARRAGEGFLAQGSAWLHFGLGDARVLGAVVHWPAGVAEAFEGVQRGGRYVLRQGEGIARAFEPPRAPSVLEPSRREPSRPTGRARVVLPVRVPMPRLTLTSPGGREGVVYGVRPHEMSGSGRPLLLSLWSRECAPCVVELRELAAAQAEIGAAGMEVMALGVDGADDESRAAAAAYLEESGWPYFQASAAEGTLDVLDVFQGALLDRETRIALPTSFLIDPAGDVLVMYTGRVDPEVVLADLALVGASPDVQRGAASPFDGRWRAQPPALDLGYFEARFKRRGLPQTAREYALGDVQIVEQSPAEILMQFGRANLRAGKPRAAIANFQAALESDPGRLDARVELARALRLAERFEESVGVSRAGLEIEARAAGLWYELCAAEHARGEQRAAREALERLRALDPALADELEGSWR